jgi:hypothetical protein
VSSSLLQHHSTPGSLSRACSAIVADSTRNSQTALEHVLVGLICAAYMRTVTSRVTANKLGVTARQCVCSWPGAGFVRLWHLVAVHFCATTACIGMATASHPRAWAVVLLSPRLCMSVFTACWCPDGSLRQQPLFKTALLHVNGVLRQVQRRRSMPIDANEMPWAIAPILLDTSALSDLRLLLNQPPR